MIRIVLIGLLLLVALTALPSGLLLMLYPDGSYFQMSLAMLAGTPFKDYVIPGLVLCLVVGGSALAALVAIFLKRDKARSLALVAGVMQGGWVVVQMLLLGAIFYLQFIYLGVGAAIFVLALLWKDKEVGLTTKI